MKGDGQTLLRGMGSGSSSAVLQFMCPCRHVSSSLFIIGGAGASFTIRRWWCGALITVRQWWPPVPFIVDGVVVWGSVLWFKGGGGGCSLP